MGKMVVSVSEKKKELQRQAKHLNLSLKKMKINRESYVCPISQSFVRKLTRKGYPIPKKNYALYVRNKK